MRAVPVGREGRKNAGERYPGAIQLWFASRVRGLICIVRAFRYVCREYLGSVRTWVYDVHPKVNGNGRFYGRTWVEDQEGNVVRFNGTFTPS